jgi:hypothetical protein
METSESIIEITKRVVEKIGNPKQHKDVVLRNIDPQLYEDFIRATSFMPEETKLSERIRYGETGANSPLVCVVCGNAHFRIQPVSQRNYCSMSCYFSDSKAMKERVSDVNQVDRVKKMAATNKKKYGYEYNSQRPEVKKILKKSKLRDSNPEALKLLQDEKWLVAQYQSKTSVEIAEELGVFYGTVISYLRDYGVDIIPHTNTSSIERSIGQFLDRHEIVFTTSDRTILGNKELDIYIPDSRFAIEANGLYWHSHVDFTNSKRHLEKTDKSLASGIQLMHITDQQWLTKSDIVQSMILNSLGYSKVRIPARKCNVKHISIEDAKVFCDTNHINGYTNASVKYGAFHEGTLVMVMTFSKPRYNKKHQWEIIRMCSALNTTVVGGASKIFSHFIRENRPESIVTFADRQYGEGKVYEKMGFEFSHRTPVGYSWTDGTRSYNRLNFQKHKLKDKLSRYDEELSERVNMVNNGYKMYFDCGHNVYVWKQ